MSRATQLKRIARERERTLEQAVRNATMRAVALEQLRCLRCGVLLMFADKFGYGTTQLRRIDKWIKGYCDAHFPVSFESQEELSTRISELFIDAVNMVAEDKLRIGEDKGRRMAEAFYRSMDGIGQKYVEYRDIERVLKEEYGMEVTR